MDISQTWGRTDKPANQCLLRIVSEGPLIECGCPCEHFVKQYLQLVYVCASVDVQAAPERESNGSLVAALAKAYRWQEQLESGEYASLEDLAAANCVDRTCVGRFLRLTSLAPELVERILDGDEPAGVSLRRLQKDLPLACSDQVCVARVRR